MVERFLSQTSFTSQEDFIKNLKINVPENFNFGYDVVDAWAAEQPDKPALLWTNDQGRCRQFTFADMKRYTDMTASYFQSLGIGHDAKAEMLLTDVWLGTRKENARRNDRHRPGQDCCLPQDCAGLSFTSLIFVPKIKFVHRSPHLCRCGQGAYRQSVCIQLKYLHKFRVAVLSIPLTNCTSFSYRALLLILRSVTYC